MNSTRFNIVFFAILSLGSCSRGATPSATTDAISIGGTVISLPAPDGFFRYDGKSAKVDRFEQQFVSATNRLLATFGSEETLGEVLKDQVPQSERHFAAESERSLETRDITASLFAQLKPSLRRTVSAPLDEKYRSVIEEMESSASSSAGASIRLGEIIPLGVFDDTSEYFHLVAQTHRPNLRHWMHWLLVAYTVYFNRRHRSSGHLFQGRSVGKLPLYVKRQHPLSRTE